ncbi:MAG: hypothetical protein QW791_04590 [Candidatus Bathyarchaeia archaeon]
MVPNNTIPSDITPLQPFRLNPNTSRLSPPNFRHSPKHPLRQGKSMVHEQLQKAHTIEELKLREKEEKDKRKAN